MRAGHVADHVVELKAADLRNAQPAAAGQATCTALTAGGEGPGRLWAIPGPVAERRLVLGDIPRLTLSKAGIPGDPVNVAMVGTEVEVVRALMMAGWNPAAPPTLNPGKGMVAPLSSLILWDRKQDLSFQRPVAISIQERHSLRLWRSPQMTNDVRPIWLGAVARVNAVELSHQSGQVTHHIRPDIDVVSAQLMDNLEQAWQLLEEYAAPGFGPVNGRNAGGDRYYTEGDIAVGVLPREGEALPAK